MAKVQLFPWLWAAGGCLAVVALYVLVPLSLPGVLASAAFLFLSNLLLSVGLRRREMPRFGAANATTATRSALAGLVTALVVSSFTRSIPVPLLVSLAAIALVLDGVDGWLARRMRCESELGARFDMEVDAFLILMLSGFDARELGWWILAIGLMRYAFVAVGWALPWMRAALPPRYWRKIVAAFAGVGLTLCSTGLLPRYIAAAILLLVLALLLESFGRDCVWLYRRRMTRADRSRDDALARV
jgi:phosphatidylglycerophosphate synthase